MKKTKWMVVVSMMFAVFTLHTQAAMSVKTYMFIVTSASSPSNSTSLQNAMSFMDKGGVTGYISTDVENDPTALNMPGILRGSQIIYGPANLKFWDGTNNPSGNFSNQCGSRIAWGLDWSNSVPFLASDVFFTLSSSDPANALSYVGNIATNTTTGLPLTFSTTLRGELWHAGVKVSSYFNGEDVATHPVNRVIALIREGYYATDMNMVQLNLSYFRGQMNFGSMANFYTKQGDGIVNSFTNSVNSHVQLVSPLFKVGDSWHFMIKGQRSLGLVYTLERSPIIEPALWFVVSTGPEGHRADNTATGKTAFYRLKESLSSPGALKVPVTSHIPKIVVENGAE
jgi:hypothetical protein